MTFPISDLDLDLSNINKNLPLELFNVINDTINETSVVCPELVIGDHFTENSQMSLADYGFFLSFRNGKTLQSDIEDYMSNFKIGIEPFSKQHISKQRMFIKPEYFKRLSRNFLCNIDYSIDNTYLKTFKGFFLLAGDGSDEKLPDFQKSAKNLIFITHQNTENHVWANFHQYRMYLMDLHLDGILGNYKEGELPLMQQFI